MGYTHYWNYKKKSPNFEQEMINVHLDIQTGLRHIDRDKIVLRGGDGTGNPEFTTESIIFNGDGNVGLDHKTFYFDGNPTDFEFHLSQSGSRRWPPSIYRNFDCS